MVVITTKKPDEEVFTAVKKFVTQDKLDNINGKTKKEVKEKIHLIEDELFEKFEKEIEEEVYSKGDISEKINI